MIRNPILLGFNPDPSFLPRGRALTARPWEGPRCPKMTRSAEINAT